jgi:hypothetical protein
MREKTTKRTPRIAIPASARRSIPDVRPIVGPVFFHARRPAASDVADDGAGGADG